MLISRISRIIDRWQALNAIADEDKIRDLLESDIPRVKRRALLLNKAIRFSTISAILTSALIVIAFMSAYFNMAHEYGVAAFFTIAFGFFTAALVNLAREITIALNEYDHFSSS